MRKKQEFWNFTAGLAFIVLFLLSVYLIDRVVGIESIFSLGLFDFLLISLATFRLVHLLTYDKIFNWVRDFFYEEGENGDKVPERIVGRVVYEMLECLWCTGVWSALFAVTIYLLSVWGQFFVILLAAAGVGSLLQVVSKVLAERND